MSLLDATSRAFLEKSRDQGMLVLVEKIPHEAIGLFCGDGDQEIPYLCANYPFTLCGKRRHHLHCQNGAYLGKSGKAWALEQITASVQLKKISTIVICGHAPCGMAHHLGLSVEQQFAEQQRFIAELKNKDSSLTVLSHFHVNWGGKVELFELRF